MTDVSAGLSLTGERTLPGIWHENYWFRRHEAAYGWVASRIHGRVLEAGAGEGYGAELLRLSGASGVVALDYDASAARHARATYPEVAVVRGNLVALPVRTASVDSVVSLQTVEHLWDQPLFVAECARVLRPAGQFAVSTPNRWTFSPGLGRGEKPANLFHTNELDPGELADLLSRRFVVDSMVGVRHGERIQGWERRYGSLVVAQLSTPCERWPDALRAIVRSVTAEDFVVTGDGIGTSLDLLALAHA